MLPKKLLLPLVVITLLSSLALGQEKNYYFVSTIDTLLGIHGIAVDPAGKIWYASYSDTAGIKVLSPDGVPAPFSPIRKITVGSVTHNVAKGCRGMAVDPNGNIIVVMNDTQLFRINYKDGSGMTLAQFPRAVTKPGVDAQGNIYLGSVAGSVDPGAPPRPLWILDANFDSLGVVTDSMQVWSRAVEVTPNGLDLYVGSLWQMVVQHYHSDDGIVYSLVDSLPGPAAGFFAGHTTGLNLDREGRLWVSDEGENCYYIYDLKTSQWKQLKGSGKAAMQGPRGVAFSAAGDTAYIINFGSGAIQMWVRETTYASPLLFDDFEVTDTTNAAWGGQWTTFTDNSPATVINWDVAAPNGFGGSTSCLQVNVTYAMWGGIVGIFNKDWNPVSLAQFDGIYFAAQGEAVPVMMRLREKKAETERGWCYYKYVFTPSAEWKEYVVPYDSLVPQWDPGPGAAPWNPLDLYAIDFGPASAGTTIDVYIDDIKFWRGTPPITSVKSITQTSPPSSYSLSQNYPNPFNPTTTIEFDLQKRGFVSLQVFDLLGQEVATLLNAPLGAGKYAIPYNAPPALASGVYIYRLEVNGTVLAKRMLLAK